jgi:hypothetical protein
MLTRILLVMAVRLANSNGFMTLPVAMSKGLEKGPWMGNTDVADRRAPHTVVLSVKPRMNVPVAPA